MFRHSSPKSAASARIARFLAAAVTGTLLTLSVGVQAKDMADIEAEGLKVATEDNYAPFNYIEQGNPVGFTADMLVELRKYASFDVNQEILPWTGLLAAVSTGQYDMAMTGALVTDERLRVFNYTPPYASAQHFYIKRADDDSLNSVADLSEKTVGVQAGSALLSRLPELETMLEESGGELGKVVQYESYPEAFADLANGRLDYVIDAAVPADALVASKPDIFAKGQAVSGPGYVSFPVPKNNEALLEYMTGFMNKMQESGRLAELQEKWFGQAFPDMPATPIKSVEQFHELTGMSE